MTRIDFYILQQPGQQENFTCRLTEKVYKTGHKLFIHTDSDEKSSQLDALLWTFRDQSFIPHSVLAANNPAKDPVLISHEHEPADTHDVMINLAENVPLFFSRFERVAEIVPAEEPGKSQARERYTFYKDRGYQIETHNI